MYTRGPQKSTDRYVPPPATPLSRAHTSRSIGHTRRMMIRVIIWTLARYMLAANGRNIIVIIIIVHAQQTYKWLQQDQCYLLCVIWPGDAPGAFVQNRGTSEWPQINVAIQTQCSYIIRTMMLTSVLGLKLVIVVAYWVLSFGA